MAKKQSTFQIEGLEYITVSEGAEMLGVRRDRFGKLLLSMIPNGLRTFNTSRNNKGIKICKCDLEAMRDEAIKQQVSITEIELT